MSNYHYQINWEFTSDPPAPDDQLNCLELCSHMEAALTEAQLRPNGSAAADADSGKAVLDPDWGADLAELVTRATWHDVDDADDPHQERVLLDTVSVDVDRAGEVMAWNYERETRKRPGNRPGV